jgi:RimJ/RimL family protein N-acetyltransferase
MVTPARPLKTQRMILQPLEPRHAAGPYLAWMNDPDVTRYLESRFRSHSREDLERFIADANAAESTLLLGMFLKDDDRHIGNVKLAIDPPHRRAELGLMIGEPSAWGQGLGTEAIDAVTRHAFTALGMHKVTAGCYADNLGSLRAFLKAGFAQEGMRPSHYRSGEAWVDMVLLGKINPDD